MPDPIAEAVASQGLTTDNPYGITVIVCNHTNGVIDQLDSVTEYAKTAQEQVFKFQWIADEVIAALNGSNEAGSGGALRSMGEMFQAAMADPATAANPMEAFMEAAKAHGQGRKKAK